MNIKDLEYFVAVFNKKNFSQAATQKKVSQPTITTAIKKLEKEFSVKLFIRDRSHQRLEPTKEGKQLFIHVKKILTELNTSKKELLRLSNTKIRVGLPPIIGNYYFPNMAPALFHSGLINKIETVEAGSSKLQSQLINGDLDIALLGSLSPIINRTLNVQQFASAPFNIIVSPKNPLARRQKISFMELKNEPFIVLNKGFVHQTALREISNRAHYRPQVSYHTTDIHILKALVAENLGIGFLTASAITKADPIRSLTLTDDEQPIFYMSTAYRKTKLLLKNEKHLLRLIQKELIPI